MKKILPILLAAFIIVGCNKDENNTQVFTFENVPESYLAGPTARGESITEGYSGYHDPLTDLRFDSNVNEYSWWGSGIAISNWTDKETAGYENACSVYAGGGHSGSDIFGVSYGSTSIYFNTTGAEYIIEEMWVTNGTYAVLSMMNGDSWAKKFTHADKDWFKLTIKGYKSSSDVETGIVEFYLADFRTAGSPGIITEWSKIDLTSLGKVHSIKFELSSSDNDPSGLWMNTPAYFCLDNIVVRK